MLTTKDDRANADAAGPPAFKVRVLIADDWPFSDVLSDGVLYSKHLPSDSADGLLSVHIPSNELLTFAGPKLWVTSEPMWHSVYRSHPIGRLLVKKLAKTEWAHFNHPEAEFRIPHQVVSDAPHRVREERTMARAVAVVTNFGGPRWFLKPHIWIRNRMILDPRVDLYGSRKSWEKFRHFPALLTRRPPGNYKGTPPREGYQSREQLAFLSQYKVCVCLENSCEPNYFTEKFVNAVLAGCIPVYHAHETVRDTFLRGAAWVDPKTFRFRPSDTIRHALAEDLEKFRGINDAWLDSGILDSATPTAFWNKILRIMNQKLTHRIGTAR